MTSVDDTSKRFEDVDRPQEIESNTLDGSKVRCFPTVKRTFRQKQSSWRWRWKYFTRYATTVAISLELQVFYTAQIYENHWTTSDFTSLEAAIDSFQSVPQYSRSPGDFRGKHR